MSTLVKVIERDGDESWTYVTTRDEAEGDPDLEIIPEPVTVEEIAEHLDRELESENYHSMVGAHASLLALLKTAGVGKAARARIFEALADKGGIIYLA